MVADEPSVEIEVDVETEPAGVPAEAEATVMLAKPVPVLPEKAEIWPDGCPYPPPACALAVCTCPESVAVCVWVPNAEPVKLELEDAVWLWETKVAFALPPVAATA